METCHRNENGVAAVRSATTQDQQFARFLEAANQLGEHLNTNFDEFFEKIVVKPALTPHAPVLETSQPIRGNVYRIEHAINRKLSSPQKSIEQSQSAPLGHDSLFARLHFAEAMMVLVFNALNETKRDSVRQHFRTLSKKCENLEIRGIPLATFHAYRDALRSMEDMLASNPQPEEMAVALSDDFVKRYARGTQ